MKLRLASGSIYSSFLFCFLSVASSSSVPQVAWVQDATSELSEMLQAPVDFLQSGPQNVFYVQDLYIDSKHDVVEVLDKYRPQVSVGGAIVLLGANSKIAYWATPTNEAQLLTNVTMTNFYRSLVDGSYPGKESQEAAVEPAEIVNSQIIGSNRAKVDQLLNNWTSEPSEANPSNINYYDPDETVKLTVSFESDNRAVAASVVNLYGIPISQARVNQLLSIIGGPSPDIVRYDGDIVEFYVGDAYLY